MATMIDLLECVAKRGEMYNIYLQRDNNILTQLPSIVLLSIIYQYCIDG